MARTTPTKGIITGTFPTIAPRVEDPQAEAMRVQVETAPLWLKIPPGLYEHYRAWRLRDVGRYIRVGSIPLVLLAMVLTAVSSSFFSGELNARDTDIWTWGSLSVCIVLVGGVAMAQLDFFRRHFEMQAAVLGGLLIAKFVATPQLLENPSVAAAESYFCMITITVVTLALRLTLRRAAIVYASGGVLGLLVAAAWSVDGIDWRNLGYYYLSMGVVCLFVAWLFEEQEKMNYLQGMLIVRAAREKEELIQELSRLAHQDALSGLANRREFDRRLATEWDRLRREQKPLTVLFIDVDHFKAYNDHYGHSAGDEALTAVGKAIAGALLRPADLAARYGGEEFVVLLPDTDDCGAEDVAERVMAAINRLAIPHAMSPTAGHVTASIGVATVLPATADSPQQLLERADGALYAAKQGGRWQVRVAPEPDTGGDAG